MKLNGLTLLYENKEAILALAVLIIVFFVFWTKKIDKKKIAQMMKIPNNSKEKWLMCHVWAFMVKRGAFFFLDFLFLFFFAFFENENTGSDIPNIGKSEE